jgi:choloylglycine hydrolase
MCTNLMLAIPNVEAPDSSSADGQSGPTLYVSARCLEMPGVIEQSLYVMRSGESFPLRPAPFPMHHRLSWTSTEDFVAIAPSGHVLRDGAYSPEMVWDVLPCINDGINTSGLSIGALWLAPGTDYPQPSPTTYNEVSFLEFPAWVLGRFTRASDVKAALLGANGGDPEITVVGPPRPGSPGADDSSKFYVPLHYVVTDATGQSIVIEFVNGETQVHDSTNAVLANEPTYDWHHTNVHNDVHLSPVDNPTSVTGSGRPGGSGLIGLPGDPTSPSRFVKAWCLSEGYRKLPADGTGWIPAPGGMTPNHAPPGFASGEQTGVVTALQLVQMCMGTPYGMLIEKVAPSTRDQPTESADFTFSDFTMWTSVRDHVNANYYFISAFSGVLARVDLSAIDFSTAPKYPGNLTIPVLAQPGEAWCADVTSQLEPARA